MTPTDALALAQTRGLDLVEVAPTSVPPVCRILDYGKYVYEQNKKQHEAKKKQRHIHVKEVKFRPKTEEHDYDFKRKHIERFLKQGDKVKVSIMFRGREMQHLEYGRRILDRVRAELDGTGIVETSPRVEGHFMSMIMAPKKGAAPAEKPAAKPAAVAKTQERSAPAPKPAEKRSAKPASGGGEPTSGGGQSSPGS
jgi:translation initiation factor IF-3